MLAMDWVRQFCEALVKLGSLQELQLSRLVLTGTSAQLLAAALAQLPKLNKLVLSGGAVPLHSPELAMLLNGKPKWCLGPVHSPESSVTQRCVTMGPASCALC